MTTRKQNNNSNEWPQIFAIFVVSLPMLNFGLFYAWPSPSIAILTRENHPLGITLEEASYLTVLSPIGMISVALPLTLLVESKGHRFTMLFGMIPYLISWILIAIGNSIWIFYSARFISGIGDACSISACLVYAGEVSVPKVRGKWANLLTLMPYFGVLLINTVGSYLDITTSAYIFVTIPIISFVLLYFIPESPYFLIMKDRGVDAKSALKWLRNNENVDDEYNSISDAVQRQMTGSGTYRDLFVIESNRKGLIANILLRIAQQFSGVSAFTVYSETIFEFGGGSISSMTSAVACASVQLMVSTMTSLMQDKFGRRKALFNSATGCIIILILMAIFFYLDTETDIDVSVLNWFPLVGMIIYFIVYCVGLALLPSLMAGELLSSSVKGKSMGIYNIIYAASIASTTKIFQVLADIRFYVPFVFFAISCAVATASCYFVVPETKGKTLDEIQLAFKEKKNAVNNHSEVRSDLQLF